MRRTRSFEEPSVQGSNVLRTTDSIIRIEQLNMSNSFLREADRLMLTALSTEEHDYSVNPYNYLTTSEAEETIRAINVLCKRNRRVFLHCLRVGIFSLILGKSLGFEDYHLLFIGGCLHDIGKLLVPNDILDKPGKLTDDEFLKMREHVIHGYQFLIRNRILNEIITSIAKYHHRTYNGNGYPAVTEGDVVSKLVQVTTICDSFDAMCEKRVYSEGKSLEEAISEIIRCKGSQFNPEITDVFLSKVPEFYTFIKSME